MSRRTLWVLIGVMAIATGGLIVVQSYWINNAVSVKEQQFRFLALRTLGSLLASLKSMKP
jgi:hypothetical protein